MIPFARISKYGNIITFDYILDIDFSTEAIGTTMITDNCGTSFALNRETVGVVEYNAEVDANVYNCVNSVGYVRSVLPIQGTLLDFTRYNRFEIEYKMKCNTNALQVFFETGGYNTRRIYGVGNSFNQYAGSYNQLFIDWGQYARCLAPWNNELKWDTIKLEFKKGVSITMSSELYGTTVFPWYEIVSNSSQYFSLFGSYIDGDNNANPYPFTGMIQYIKIRAEQ